MLTELEQKIIAEIQGDIPITDRPFLDIARKIGISEETLLNTLKSLNDKGMIRRFGATLRHQKSGFEANAMVAWKVEEDRIDAVGRLMASSGRVSHCYRRNPTREWEYNLYTMIHAKDESSCMEIARNLAEKAGLDKYTLLFSRKELKKTSMQYFPNNVETS
jgi:siroheme decarboxylase